MKLKMILISIEGVVGAGKTVVLGRLHSFYPCIYEPVWKYSEFGKFNPLELSYTKPEQNAAISQHHIIVESCKYYKQQIDLKKNSESIVFMERSILSPEPFIFTGVKRGIFSDFVAEYLLKELKIHRSSIPKPDLIIWLECPLEECDKRITRRARTGEKRCTIDFNKNLVQAYNESILGSGEFPILKVSSGPDLTPRQVANKIEMSVHNYFKGGKIVAGV